MRTIFLIMLLVNGFFICSAQDTKERWDVKTLTDGFTPTAAPLKVTVDKEGKRVKVGVRNTTPRMNFEKVVITVTGKITRKVKEADTDIHIEITDGSRGDSTIACESVDPTDPQAKNSPSVNKFIKVRADLAGFKVGDTLTITGIQFQDKKHGKKTARIQNFMEIHPILSIKAANED